MNIQISESFDGVYLLNPQINQQQLYDAIAACLCKAEALAMTAAAVDFEAYTSDIISNYLWALSDIVREARYLYEKTYQGIE